jgi:hypothetical protein
LKCRHECLLHCAAGIGSLHEWNSIHAIMSYYHRAIFDAEALRIIHRRYSNLSARVGSIPVARRAGR